MNKCKKNQYNKEVLEIEGVDLQSQLELSTLSEGSSPVGSHQ